MCLKLYVRVRWAIIRMMFVWSLPPCCKHQISQEFSKGDLDKCNGQNSIKFIAGDELEGKSG